MNNPRQIFKWRLAILVAVVLYCLSTSLLLIASTAPQRIEAGQVTPLGIVDVVTAFVVVIFGMVIYGKGMKLVTLPTWQTSYLVATVLPALILVGIWLFLGKIYWLDVLLPGLAWRVYILLQTLPAAVAIWNQQEGLI
jgi:hypothetical protein